MEDRGVWGYNFVKNVDNFFRKIYPPYHGGMGGIFSEQQAQTLKLQMLEEICLHIYTAMLFNLYGFVISTNQTNRALSWVSDLKSNCTQNFTRVQTKTNSLEQNREITLTDIWEPNQRLFRKKLASKRIAINPSQQEILETIFIILIFLG